MATLFLTKAQTRSTVSQYLASFAKVWSTKSRACFGSIRRMMPTMTMSKNSRISFASVPWWSSHFLFSISNLAKSGIF